jgi:hypothetical protein
MHIPLILSSSGKKLAKRDPFSSVKNLMESDYEI